jgi:hypothetical protein
MKLTRREFLYRSAPLVAAGVVAPSLMETLVYRLFGVNKYWDMGWERPNKNNDVFLATLLKPTKASSIITMENHVVLDHGFYAWAERVIEDEPRMQVRLYDKRGNYTILDYKDVFWKVTTTTNEI